MPRQNGRDLVIVDGGGTPWAVVNTKSVAINNTPVTVTGDDDNGFVTMLARPGTRQISLEISGVRESDYRLQIAVDGTALLGQQTIRWLSADGLGTPVYEITGQFFMGTYSESGSHDGSIEFSASLSSSGQFTGAVVQ